MTEEEIKIQKALGTYLSMKWKECQKLLKEGNEHYKEGWKFLPTKGNAFFKRGHALCDAGYKLYRDAVKEIYGDKEVWINWGTGEMEILPYD